jgi:hypothetical protein
MLHEPKSTLDATNCVIGILDAKYEKADLRSVIDEHCAHLSLLDRNKLLDLLTEYEDLFDGTLGEWNTDLYTLNSRKEQNRSMAGLSQYQKYTKTHSLKN